MNELISKIELVTQRIAFLKDAISTECTSRVLDMKLESVQTLYGEGNSYIDKLYIKGDESEKAQALKLGNKLSEISLEVEIHITDIMSKLVKDKELKGLTETDSKTLPRLPKLELPVFSGGYTEWIAFYDLFDCAINKRADLSDVQKLQYLKCSLKEGSTISLLG